MPSWGAVYIRALEPFCPDSVKESIISAGGSASLTSPGSKQDACHDGGFYFKKVTQLLILFSGGFGIDLGLGNRGLANAYSLNKSDTVW